MNIRIGDKIKVLDQDITGYVVKVYENSVVIEDNYAETEDNTLEFRFSEIEEVIQK
ncbi:MAG: DUF2187 domain-containing protein [Actinobacteria bacterium]|nr:DUF2187 domain-containing protein [Actinomycetota bacterium]